MIASKTHEKHINTYPYTKKLMNRYSERQNLALTRLKPTSADLTERRATNKIWVTSFFRQGYDWSLGYPRAQETKS